MDKLKPILAQKFWILLFLALLLPTIGWFLASSQSAEAIETRRGELESAFNSVNFPPNGVANTDWVSNARLLVEEEQKRLDTASQMLWTTQAKVMQWPEGMTHLVENLEPNGQLSATALESYRRDYYRHLAQIEKILQPFQMDTATGLVLYDRSAITHVPDGTWLNLPPSSKEAWEAQEDLWLTQAIFESIAAVNKGAEKITDATVRELTSLTFRGGTRDYSSATGATGDSSGADTLMMETGGYNPNANAQGDAKLGAFNFDLSDEFGPNSTGTGSMTTDYSTLAEQPGDASAATPKGPVRYVDDADDLPFRTRAFVLEATIDHRQLNAFLASLSESEWPLQVIRVNVELLNPDNLDAMSGRTGTSTTSGRSSYRPMSTETSMDETPGSSFGNRFNSGRRTPGTTSSTGRNPRGTTIESQAAQLLSQQAMRDPFLARVCVGGLMTLFKPSTAPAVPATDEIPVVPESTETPAAPVAEAPAATDPAAPAAETPVDPAATPAEAPADPATKPATPDAPASDPANPGEKPPATPAEPATESTPAPAETPPPSQN